MRIQHVVISVLPLLSLGALTGFLLTRPKAPDQTPPATLAAKPAAAPQPAKKTGLADDVWNRFRPVDFKEIFKSPAGDYGLEFRPEFAAAAGQEVRFTGHMVQHAHEDHAVFLLTPQPMRLNMQEYGLADDLPPWAMHVILPEKEGSAPAWTGAPITVCGVLEIGNRQEKDGRVSPFRLFASHVLDPQTREEITVMKPVVLQRDRLRTARQNPEALPRPD